MKATAYGKLFLCILGLTLVWQSCKKKNTALDYRTDAIAMRILEIQDRRETKALIHYLKSKQSKHRELAALAFASIRDTAALPWLYVSMLSDGDSTVRKACALAIGLTADSNSVETLIEALESEPVVGVQGIMLEAIGRCGGLKAAAMLRSFPSQNLNLTQAHALAIFRLAMRRQVDTSFVPLLRAFIHTPAAATALYAWQKAGLPPDSLILTPLTRSNNSEISRMAQRIMNGVPQPVLISPNEFKAKIIGINNPYQVASLIKLLNPEDAESIEIWFAFTETRHPACIRSHAADLYTRHARKFQNVGDYLRALKTFMNSGDMALQSLASIALTDTSNLSFNQAQTLLPDLVQARKKLLLPRDTETQRDLDKAIAFLQNKTFLKTAPVYNHPPDWSYFNALSDTVYIELTTNKGIIKMHWLPKHAPASVTNICQLVDSGFYNLKYFHRVVPNFVIQGGCPRGDGWGALNWSQRTEVSNYLKYTRGTVGLASAGPDTEGVQFFITHVPTPNLEGNYTILGYVYQGMEVVDQIQEGDQIIQMKRLKHP